VTAGTTDSQGAPQETRSVLRRVRSADVLISVVLLAVFIAVFIGAQEWPFRTRLFPVLVAGGGIAMSVLNILLALLRPHRKSATVHKLAGVELKDEDEEEDEALEYVFESASKSDWARVLAWVAAFFVLMYLVGALFTVPAFALVYLVLEARTTVLVSVVYAALLGALLFAGRELLQMSLPAGALLAG
jgi:Kef-type K+ transport system membrane component KefB